MITLGIIGVVAAMTLPTLLNSTHGAQYRTSFKKAISVISQAVTANVALDDYDFSQAVETNVSLQTNGTSASVYNIFKNRINLVSTNSPDSWSSGNASFGSNSNYTLYFNDGITITFEKSAAFCTKANPCYGAIDVNGKKNPNKMVACNAGTSGASCKVSHPTDIYPVKLYGQMIMPATNAGTTILYTDKKDTAKDTSSSGGGSSGGNSSGGSSGGGSSGGGTCTPNSQNGCVGDIIIPDNF